MPRVPIHTLGRCKEQDWVIFPTKYIRFGFVSACVQVHRETGENPALTGSLAWERNERGGSRFWRIFPPRREAVRTSNPALSPAGDSDPVYTGSWRSRGWCNCLCTPSQDQTWRGAPHASATVLARLAPARGRRPASAPRAPAGAAPRAPSRVYTNLFARDWVDPARSLRQGPG